MTILPHWNLIPNPAKPVRYQGSNASGFKSRSRHFAGIAQLAVRITCNDEVIGSTPIASSCWKAKKYTKPSSKISTMNPVGFYDSPSGEKLVQRKDIRDQYSHRRGSRFLRRLPAKMQVCDASDVVGCGRGKRRHVRLYRYARIFKHKPSVWRLPVWQCWFVRNGARYE